MAGVIKIISSAINDLYEKIEIIKQNNSTRELWG